ncbi:hypothetical protein BD310DRAFT_979917 [Dichomitus squalens]|uniref:NmrA-like domain-containing protein n=1 Tax=Dichomitus squalens TaxID=114155 RepID=A0A4Q9PLI7_9APHY|nr:hypothetical protein BD310DRAFT_979917 [Dichomitus squalens]
MASTDKPLVLVVGTGQTGSSIIQGLLSSGNFRVAALVRPSSLLKFTTEALSQSGIEIRVGNLQDSVETHEKTLEGVNILISAVSGFAIADQKDVIRTAKNVGVQRVVPCDFATPGAKGVRILHDANSTSRTHSSTSGGGCNNFLPLPARTRVPPDVAAFTHLIVGTGEARTLVTDLRRIGLYVARIVGDPQTLNHAVIAWDEEVQSLRAHEIGERVSGDGDAMKAKRIYLEPEQVVKAVKEVKKEFSKHPDRPDWMRLGYLDARELYPDLPKYSLTKFAEEFYKLANRDWNTSRTHDRVHNYWFSGFIKRGPTSQSGLMRAKQASPAPDELLLLACTGQAWYAD